MISTYFVDIYKEIFWLVYFMQGAWRKPIDFLLCEEMERVL